MRAGEVIGDLTVDDAPVLLGNGRDLRFLASRGGRRFRVRSYEAPLMLGAASGSRPLAELDARHEEVARRLDAGQIGCGNLVAPTERFRHGSRAYRVSEDPGGVPVRAMGAMTPRQWTVIVRTVVFGIHAMHERGVVHGDLGLDRVAVVPAGDGLFTARLIDLDEAYVAGSPPAVDLIGADPAGRAPELTAYVEAGEAAGPGGAEAGPGPAADIFSLGLVLFQLSTGRWPTAGGGVAPEPGRAISQGAALDLRGLPADLQEIVSAMLRVDPRGRPTIGTVAVAIKAAGLGAWTVPSGSAIVAPPPVPAPRPAPAAASAPASGPTPAPSSSAPPGLRGTLGRGRTDGPDGS